MIYFDIYTTVFYEEFARVRFFLLLLIVIHIYLDL